MARASDSNIDGLNSLDPSRSLLIIRIIWAGLIVGPLAFLAIVALVVLPQSTQPAKPEQIFFFLCVAMLLTTVPVGFFVRHVMFRRSARDGRVAPGDYFNGNIIFWACCEGVALLSIMLAILNGTLWPTVIVAAVALCLQLLTFPRASQLASAPPALDL